MAVDKMKELLIKKEWNKLRLPILEKLNSMHADIILVNGEKCIDDSIADTKLNIKRMLAAKSQEVTE